MVGVNNSWNKFSINAKFNFLIQRKCDLMIVLETKPPFAWEKKATFTDYWKKRMASVYHTP